MTRCKNCGNEISGNFCGNCGHPVKLKRIDAHYIMHEITHVLHFEKGIFFTIKELLIRPGQNVREFLTDNRNRLVKPVIFIIISSLIYSIVNHIFHVEDGYIKFSDSVPSAKGAEQSAATGIFDWITHHYGYSNIIMGVFIAFWLKVFFKKYAYNLYELLILLCFVMGMSMLILSVFALFQGISHQQIMQAGGMVSILYCAWAIACFFDGGKWLNYLRSFAGYMLGMLSFMLCAIFLGLIVDYLKH